MYKNNNSSLLKKNNSYEYKETTNKKPKKTGASLYKKEKRADLEFLMKYIFFFSAALSVVSLCFIIYFIFSRSLPFLRDYGLLPFLSGEKWTPSNRPQEFGLLPMIVGSVIVTTGSVLIGAPVGILTAVYLVDYCPPFLYRFLHSAVQLMAAIPSIVYGFFALQFLVPIIRSIYGGTGMTALTAILLLAIMILPTVISLSEAALLAVPKEYYAGSAALGADHEQSIFNVVLPAARSGVLSSVVLGVGRAIGETMAVVLITGNQPLMPESLTSGVRTLTTNIVLEMAYATGRHREALIATSAVLFIFILMINIGFILMRTKERSK